MTPLPQADGNGGEPAAATPGIGSATGALLDIPRRLVVLEVRRPLMEPVPFEIGFKEVKELAAAILLAENNLERAALAKRGLGLIKP